MYVYIYIHIYIYSWIQMNQYKLVKKLAFNWYIFIYLNIKKKPYGRYTLSTLEVYFVNTSDLGSSIEACHKGMR